jgi:hypothetical protein
MTIERKEDIEQIRSQVHQMAFADDVDARQQALRSLIKTRSIHRACQLPEFKITINRICDDAEGNPDETNRLAAIAQLSRIIAVVKKSRDEVIPRIKRILREPIPPLTKATDADDRYYVAQSLECAAEAWVRPYLISSLLIEESGEKARSECVRVFLGFSPSISELLLETSDALEASSPFSEMKSDAIGRRLKRILQAFTAHILDSKTQVDEQFGAALDRFVRRSFVRAGHPDDASVSHDLANEIVTFIHEAIRANFFISAQAETYKTIKVAKGWFLDSHWPECVNETAPLLERDISQAISLLAKQGIADSNLLNQLILVSGSKDRAKFLSTRIADEIKGLPSAIDLWLRKLGSSKTDRSSDEMTESGLLSADQNLAFLLLDASSLTQTMRNQSESLLTSIRVFEPEKSNEAEKLLRQTETLLSGIEAIARKRRLKLQGDLGSVQEFAPNEHEYSGVSGVGSRYVKIVRPAVVRTKGDAGFDVVVKAQVEPDS